MIAFLLIVVSYVIFADSSSTAINSMYGVNTNCPMLGEMMKKIIIKFHLDYWLS